MYLEDHPRTCKWLVTHLAHLEGEQPYLGDLLTMVNNHLLTGMILQVDPGHHLESLVPRSWQQDLWSGLQSSLSNKSQGQGQGEEEWQTKQGQEQKTQPTNQPTNQETKTTAKISKNSKTQQLHHPDHQQTNNLLHHDDDVDHDNNDNDDITDNNSNSKSNNQAITTIGFEHINELWCLCSSFFMSEERSMESNLGVLLASNNDASWKFSSSNAQELPA